jgi:hypothetical protein
MPSPSVIKRTLRNQRSKRHPPTPANLQDLSVTGSWARTGGTNDEQFLMHDNGVNAESRIIMFGASDCLKHLGASSHWFMDGNFAVAPRHFKQVVTALLAIGM